MKIAEIAFTGNPVTDIERARAFYKGVLGLNEVMNHEIEGMLGKYWIEYDIAGQTLAISNTWEPATQGGGPSVALEVEDFDSTMAELKKAGVTIMAERIDSPVCHFALIADPDGNAIIIHKRHEMPERD